MEVTRHVQYLFRILQEDAIFPLLLNVSFKYSIRKRKEDQGRQEQDGRSVSILRYEIPIDKDK